MPRLYGVIQDVVFTHHLHLSCSFLSLICLSTNQNVQLMHSLLIRIEWTTGNGILVSSSHWPIYNRLYPAWKHTHAFRIKPINRHACQHRYLLIMHSSQYRCQNWRTLFCSDQRMTLSNETICYRQLDSRARCRRALQFGLCIVYSAVNAATCYTTTVGADKNETLIFVHFSAQDASILKISVPIIKRRS